MMSELESPSQEHMRNAMENYIRFFNEGNLPALLDLFTSDATVEDPVGTPVRQGSAALKEFYEFATNLRPQLHLLAPVRGSMSNASAMAFDVHVNLNGQLNIYQVIDVMTFDAQGRFTSMRAYWGSLNVKGM